MVDSMKINIIVTSNNNEDFNPQLLQTELECDFNISPLCYETKSSDTDKVGNILSALTDDGDVILAMRGGSGLTRLMAKLDCLPKLSKPKTFVGYSDLTALLNYLNKDQYFNCIHGPMAFEITTKKRVDKFAKALKKADVTFAKPAQWLVPGTISGQVVGGNLMLVTDAIGTFYQPDFYDKILLLEEIDESLEKLDRMFAQLRDTGVLSDVRAIILGNFKNCCSQSELEQLFANYLSELAIPVLYELNLGHIDDSDYVWLHTELKIDQDGIYYKREEHESD